MKWQIPNQLTVGRIALAAVFFVLLPIVLLVFLVVTLVSAIEPAREAYIQLENVVASVAKRPPPPEQSRVSAPT